MSSDNINYLFDSYWNVSSQKPVSLILHILERKPNLMALFTLYKG